MLWEDRVRRAHLLMVRSGSKDIYALPILGNPNKVGVFRVTRGKPVMLHSLEKTTRKLKKRQTVKPAYEHVVKQTGDIFIKQANHRFDRAARRTLGL